MKLTRNEKWVLAAAVGWLAFTRYPRKKTTTTSAAPRPAPTPPPLPIKAPLHARIYQGPNDTYDTVRMSVDMGDGQGFREMGIFSSRARAEAQAKQAGWIVDPAQSTP